MKINLLIIFLSFNLFPNENFIGEKLKYKADFRLFNAGDALLSFDIKVDKKDTLYYLEAEIKTNTFLDKFYRVRDNIKLLLNPLDYSLAKVEKYISQGKYKKRHVAEIDNIKNQIRYDDKIIQKSDLLYDPLSLIYVIRNKLFNEDLDINLTIYDMGKQKKIKLKNKKNEVIEVPYGKFDCFLIIPESKDEKELLKNNGNMKVWFAKNKNFLPVKIEQSTNFGKMVLELESISVN